MAIEQPLDEKATGKERCECSASANHDSKPCPWNDHQAKNDSGNDPEHDRRKKQERNPSRGEHPFADNLGSEFPRYIVQFARAECFKSDALGDERVGESTARHPAKLGETVVLGARRKGDRQNQFRIAAGVLFGGPHLHWKH